MASSSSGNFGGSGGGPASRHYPHSSNAPSINLSSRHLPSNYYPHSSSTSSSGGGAGGPQQQRDPTQLVPTFATGRDGAESVVRFYRDGTEEVRRLLRDECSLIYECSVCRSLHRSIVNFISHKRTVCRTLQSSVSRLGAELQRQLQRQQQDGSNEQMELEDLLIDAGFSNGGVNDITTTSSTPAGRANGGQKNKVAGALRRLNIAQQAAKHLQPIRIDLKKINASIDLQTLPKLSRGTPITEIRDGVQRIVEPALSSLAIKQHADEQDRTVLVMPEDNSIRYREMNLRLRKIPNNNSGTYSANSNNSLPLTKVSEREIEIIERIPAAIQAIADFKRLRCQADECRRKGGSNNSSGGGGSSAMAMRANGSFTSVAALAKHLAEVHQLRGDDDGGRATRTLHCFICGQTFKSLNILRKHSIISHSKETTDTSPTQSTIAAGQVAGASTNTGSSNRQSKKQSTSSAHNTSASSNSKSASSSSNRPAAPPPQSIRRGGGNSTAGAQQQQKVVGAKLASSTTPNTTSSGYEFLLSGGQRGRAPSSIASSSGDGGSSGGGGDGSGSHQQQQQQQPDTPQKKLEAVLARITAQQLDGEVGDGKAAVGAAGGAAAGLTRGSKTAPCTPRKPQQQQQQQQHPAAPQQHLLYSQKRREQQLLSTAEARNIDAMLMVANSPIQGADGAEGDDHSRGRKSKRPPLVSAAARRRMDSSQSSRSAMSGLEEEEIEEEEEEEEEQGEKEVEEEIRRENEEGVAYDGDEGGKQQEGEEGDDNVSINTDEADAAYLTEDPDAYNSEIIGEEAAAAALAALSSGRTSTRSRTSQRERKLTKHIFNKDYGFRADGTQVPEEEEEVPTPRNNGGGGGNRSRSQAPSLNARSRPRAKSAAAPAVESRGGNSTRSRALQRSQSRRRVSTAEANAIVATTRGRRMLSREPPRDRVASSSSRMSMVGMPPSSVVQGGAASRAAANRKRPHLDSTSSATAAEEQPIAKKNARRQQTPHPTGLRRSTRQASNNTIDAANDNDEESSLRKSSERACSEPPDLLASPEAKSGKNSATRKRAAELDEEEKAGQQQRKVPTLATAAGAGAEATQNMRIDLNSSLPSARPLPNIDGAKARTLSSTRITTRNGRYYIHPAIGAYNNINNKGPLVRVPTPGSGGVDSGGRRFSVVLPGGQRVLPPQQQVRQKQQLQQAARPLDSLNYAPKARLMREQQRQQQKLGSSSSFASSTTTTAMPPKVNSGGISDSKLVDPIAAVASMLLSNAPAASAAAPTPRPPPPFVQLSAAPARSRKQNLTQLLRNERELQGDYGARREAASATYYSSATISSLNASRAAAAAGRGGKLSSTPTTNKNLSPLDGGSGGEKTTTTTTTASARSTTATPTSVGDDAEKAGGGCGGEEETNEEQSAKLSTTIDAVASAIPISQNQQKPSSTSSSLGSPPPKPVDLTTVPVYLTAEQRDMFFSPLKPLFKPPAKDGSYQCGECSHILRCFRDGRRHMVAHVRAVRITCSLCGAGAFFCSDMRTHLMDRHCTKLHLVPEGNSEANSGVPCMDKVRADELTNLADPFNPGRVIYTTGQIVSYVNPKAHFPDLAIEKRITDSGQVRLPPPLPSSNNRRSRSSSKEGEMVGGGGVEASARVEGEGEEMAARSAEEGGGGVDKAPSCSSPPPSSLPTTVKI